MTRILGTAFAIGITAVTSTGILTLIAYEFLGDTGMTAIWKALQESSIPAAASEAFNPDKEIHFFEKVAVADSDFNVITGAAYAHVAAVSAKKPLRQWCYIAVEEDTPGLSARVDLGNQDGDEPAVFTAIAGLTSPGLEKRGLSASRLAALARTHCRFGKLDPLG
jgi:hypothetical protein